MGALQAVEEDLQEANAALQEHVARTEELQDQVERLQAARAALTNGKAPAPARTRGSAPPQQSPPRRAPARRRTSTSRRKPPAGDRDGRGRPRSRRNSYPERGQVAQRIMEVLLADEGDGLAPREIAARAELPIQQVRDAIRMAPALKGKLVATGATTNRKVRVSESVRGLSDKLQEAAGVGVHEDGGPPATPADASPDTDLADAFDDEPGEQTDGDRKAEIAAARERVKRAGASDADRVQLRRQIEARLRGSALSCRELASLLQAAPATVTAEVQHMLDVDAPVIRRSAIPGRYETIPEEDR